MANPKSALSVTEGNLEALVGTENALFGFATMNHGIEIVEWSRYGSATSFPHSTGGVLRKQQFDYTPREATLQRTAGLQTAVGYRMRVKAAADSESVIAVLYDGTSFFSQRDHLHFSQLPKISGLTYASRREGTGVDALHATASGFIISGFSTKCLRLAGNDLVHDTISGFGYYRERDSKEQSNPARCMTRITV